MYIMILTVFMTILPGRQYPRQITSVIQTKKTRKMMQVTKKTSSTYYQLGNELSKKEQIYNNYLKNRGARDIERAYKSLNISDNCHLFNNCEMNLAELKLLAKFTSSAQFNYSGNCVLLAACLHYNIKNGGYFLSAENISLPFTGLDSVCVDRLLFGNVLDESYSIASFHQLKDYIVNCYLNTGNISFIIHAESAILGGVLDTAHDFNAVVFNSDGVITIKFVDSWRIMHKVKSEKQMERSISHNTYFYVRV